jgi:serine/threonine protein kinase
MAVVTGQQGADPLVKRAAGPFEILEILGEGSFGTVCVARVQGDARRRKVALKILKGAYTRNPKILNRTRDEARMLSHINHPNVVRVERLIEIGGRPVVVMELVEGVSLDQLLLRFKQGLPAAVAVEVVRQTLIALHVAYYEATGPDSRPLKIIHRDIKPSNIMLSVRGEVKVGDFGIAKGEFSGREAETESVVLGSRPYMAPERLDGVSDHPTVDVYSCGMSLYELLTGRTMSLSINPVTHEQAMNRQLGYLSVEGMADAGLEDLRGIIRRMCAYDRDYRPGSLEAARELEQCLFAIDARFRLSVEEFARTTVLPIYESRPRIRPEDAVQDESESEFIREVTGQVTNPTITVAKGRRWTPYIFVTALSVLVAMLSTASVVKFWTSGPTTPEAGAALPGAVSPDVVPTLPPDVMPGPTSSGPSPGMLPVQPVPEVVARTTTVEPPAMVAPTAVAPLARSGAAGAAEAAGMAAASGRPIEAPPVPTTAARVEFHVPPGATLSLGSTLLERSSYVDLIPGEHVAVIRFGGGRTLSCRFQAGQADIVRLAEGALGPALHVSGRPEAPCDVVR